ncbi:hypothetical protein [Polyangium jinanense]|uniref:Uncharacterized protein n=1 Tax=Polyangium jinanense TaxID=2829994 RepID=A0A9X3XDJ8_9BACT|nr:hypothetical protein [Polyangium jinanense]MDC3957068.1 hypothetical protein [Polyangium jinanense]MDC3987058.1 hypothetical protein [Polyangium jinanense]
MGSRSEPIVTQLRAGALVGHDETLVRFPAAKLGAWIEALRDHPDPAVRARGEELHARMTTGATPPIVEWPRPAEIEAIRARAEALGLPLDAAIYALVPRRVLDPASTLRTASSPKGITKKAWPKCKSEPMEHVITLDYAAMPELRERTGHGEDVRALAVFVSKREENCAWERDSGETAVVLLSEAALAKGHGDDGGCYEAVRIAIPSVVLDPYADDEDGRIEAIRDLIRDLRARALGRPGWLQTHDEDDGAADFLAQFDEDLVEDLNCGGDGRFYVFAKDAFWEC